MSTKKEKIIFEVFSDAASYNNGRKKFPHQPELSSSVAVLTLNRVVVAGFESFNPNTTNNYGEIYAIYLAIKESYKIMRKLDLLESPYHLHAYSDSEISVKGVTTWMRNWKREAGGDYNNLWYSHGGGLVANQEIFKKIDKKFVQDKNLKLKVLHVKGHVNLDKKSDFLYAKQTFLRVNKKDIDDDKLRFIINMNNICDEYAKAVLEKGKMGYVR